jgi:hypothetical protein
VLAREGGTQPANGSMKGAQGSGNDQASRSNVEGQPLKPTRKPRKSRARQPTLTPQERREINRANATKHGDYAADRRLTSDAIRGVVKGYHYQQRDLVKRGHDWRDVYPRPPLEELCEEWRDNWQAMAAYVIAHHGLKPSRNHLLKRIREDEPWAPGNVAAWELRPPTLRKAAARDPLSALCQCVCGDHEQEACATSAHPCPWVTASRAAALWLEPTV